MVAIRSQRRNVSSEYGEYVRAVAHTSLNTPEHLVYCKDV
jgi:hypothetical protein